MSLDRCDLLCLGLDEAERARRALPDVEQLRPAARRRKALGDPIRMQAALALAAVDERCVCDGTMVLDTRTPATRALLVEAQEVAR